MFDVLLHMNLGCAWPSEAAKAATVALAVADALMSGEPSTWNHHAVDDNDDVDNKDYDCEDDVDDNNGNVVDGNDDDDDAYNEP